MKDEWNEDGQLFMDYCRKGEIENVLQMLNQGFDPNSYFNYENWSPLFIAVKFNQFEIVKILIKYGANIDCLNLVNETPLMHASINGNFQMVQLLISQGSNINLQNDEGATAISFACYYGHEKVAQILIQNGADLTQIFRGPDEIGNVTPLQICEQKNLQYLIQLIKSKL